MTHKDMFDEIRLNTFVKRLGLSIDEVEHALSLYAHNKKFDKELDAYVNGKYMLARVFPVGEGGVEFPEVKFEKIDVNNLDAMIFLYENISRISDGYLGDGVRDKMNSDFEKYS